MAIDTKEFINKVDIGLKSNKTFDRFYARIKIESKIVQRVFDYSSKSWDKKTRVAKAKIELQELREQKSPIADTSTLDTIAELYFKAREPSNWTTELTNIYRLHIKDVLGKKKIKDLRRVHLDELVSKLRKEGKSKQNKDGCSPRTIKKVLVECLKPILQYAVDNNTINKLPVFPTIKLNRVEW